MKSLSIGALVLALSSLIYIPVTANNEFEEIDAELMDRAVVLQLPEGVRRIRLRILDESGNWETHTIAHLKGSEGFLKLRVPDGVQKDEIEVSASWSDPFPYEFYSGETVFDPSEPDGNSNGARLADAEGVAYGTSESTVEESDIWKWRDQTLYFFNQYRGLQVIDSSDPADPKRVATMRVPFGGEQMYLHPTENMVVLLTYNGNTGNGQVLLVEHEDSDTLTEKMTIDVPGYILESRLVGNILYVVSRRWWQESTVDEESGVEHLRSVSGLAVSKIDMADPENVVVADPLELRDGKYNYWGGIVQATSRALMIATSAYDHITRTTLSTVHVVDISDPEVDPILTHEFPSKGHVRNKFNLNLKDDILTVVSQVWRDENRQRYASVETFDISEPSEEPVEALAALEFANNESITSSRFSGDLLYVVTFLRIDPLFVISLADPANPQLLGELEVPGFSTHLEPMGDDALVSVGVEENQIAVSWFDVSDPTDPTLASRVYIGEEDGWSWSEANWDEKAFGFFPEEGWALVPFSGYDPDNGSISGIQLVELGEGELAKRGAIEHDFRARRARVMDEVVVSISGQSLKSLDISDPDNPELLATLPLAWPVDLVHRVGDYLVQLQRGPGFWYWGGNDQKPQLHVTSLDDADELLASIALPEGRIVGSILLENYLVIAQSNYGNNQIAEGEWEYRDSFRTTIIDLSNPAEPVVLGSVMDELVSNQYVFYGSSDYQAKLLEDGTLLWYPGEQNSYFFLEPGFADSGRLSSDFISPYYSPGGKLYLVNIEDKSAPEILSSVNLLTNLTNGDEPRECWSEGQIRVLDSVVYYGLQSSEFIETVEGQNRWMARHWLGQINLSNATEPQRLPLVEIPGTFENVIDNGSGGVILFSSVYRGYYDKEVWRSAFRVQASAFDGVSAYLIDELVDEDSNYGPKLFEDEFVVLGRTEYTEGKSLTELTTYEWLNSGAFFEHQAVNHEGAIYRLGVVDDILVAPGSGELSFMDFTDPADPQKTTISFPDIYFWQRIDLIDVFERELAYIPQGWYGVETLDFGGAFSNVESSLEAPQLQMHHEDEWMIIGAEQLSFTQASGSHILEELGDGEPWAYADTVVQKSYNDWMTQLLGLGEGDNVPESAGDLDGDGVSNGFEFLTGSNPEDDQDVLPIVSWVAEGEDGERYLYLQVAQNVHSVEGQEVMPQFSYNLKDWISFPEGHEITDLDFRTGKLVRYLEPIDSTETIFIRLLLSDG
ncbi:beta-propeller domain-containing protein [Opitutia bacterium ISCC 51]|nr:beta-propeller domain-containing protein [Opitutae bacterium ISCC 51]QXD27219.1 beta-propeller domain-containing protein [Opitutae bacterium ISCC 52]